MTEHFNWRKFVSYSLSWLGIILIITGVILYIVPAGRIANWVNWKLFGITKEQWGAIHTISSFTFAILGMFHTYFNWKVLMAYFKKVSSSKLKIQAELFWSLLLVVVFTVGSAIAVPPFSSIMNFGESIKDSWEKKYESPEISHAEKLIFSDYCEKINISVEQAMERLEDAGFEAPDISKELGEIADEYKISPKELDAILRNAELKETLESTKTDDHLTEPKQDGSGAGTGQGQNQIQFSTEAISADLSFEDYCRELGVPLDKAMMKLQYFKLKLESPYLSFRELAEANELTVEELREKMTMRGVLRKMRE